jgi:hypothetical protein
MTGIARIFLMIKTGRGFTLQQKYSINVIPTLNQGIFICFHAKSGGDDP